MHRKDIYYAIVSTPAVKTYSNFTKHQTLKVSSTRYGEVRDRRWTTVALLRLYHNQFETLGTWRRYWTYFFRLRTLLFRQLADSKPMTIIKKIVWRLTTSMDQDKVDQWWVTINIIGIMRTSSWKKAGSRKRIVVKNCRKCCPSFQQIFPFLFGTRSIRFLWKRLLSYYNLQQHKYKMSREMVLQVRRNLRLNSKILSRN